jgi:hypothetical protein
MFVNSKPPVWNDTQPLVCIISTWYQHVLVSSCYWRWETGSQTHNGKWISRYRLSPILYKYYDINGTKKICLTILAQVKKFNWWAQKFHILKYEAMRMTRANKQKFQTNFFWHISKPTLLFYKLTSSFNWLFAFITLYLACF